MRAIAKRCLQSDAELIVVTAPRGFNKHALATEMIAHHGSASTVRIDVSECTTRADLSREVIKALVRVQPPDEGLSAGRPPLIILLHAERMIQAGEVDALYQWIINLTPFARVALFSRANAPGLMARLSALRIVRIGPRDLQFQPTPDHLERLAFSEDDALRFLSEFGHWPAAWERLEGALDGKPARLRSDAVRELGAMVDTEVESVRTGREVALALAVLGVGSRPELTRLTNLTDVSTALKHLDGYFEALPDGNLFFPAFVRARIIARYPAEIAALTAAAVELIREADPARALSIALQLQQIGLIEPLLAGRSAAERDALLLAAAELADLECFFASDELFILWWRTPRTREQVIAMVSRLSGRHEYQAGGQHARRALAVALFNARAGYMETVAADLNACLNDEKNLSPRLRSLARANLAWFHAWQGDIVAVERLLPALDDDHPDTAVALDRLLYIRSAGDPEHRRELIDKRLEVTKGQAALEGIAATYLAMDGFFAGDDERLAAGLARLRRLAGDDAFLARTFAYIDGTGSLDFESHTRFRAFAILLRAEREADYTKRMHLLRSAITHADESLEAEIRLATRLAFAYAHPHDARPVLDEAATFVRTMRCDAYGQAIINAERLVVAGPFAGIARRFASANDQPRVRLGILDGTIAGRSGEPIAIAQRQFELMVFLSLHEKGSADRESIVDAIWPDLEPTAAAHALKTAAHRIRTALDDAGAILLSSTGYRLPDTIEIDIDRLEGILGVMTMEDAPARLGGIPNAYRTFAMGVEQIRDRLSRWSWADRYVPRLESLLHRLAIAISHRANLTNRTEFSHRIVADLRTLDEDDETAFVIAIAAHLAEGNRVAARREHDRYVALLAAYGEAPPAAMNATLGEFAEETA